MKQQDMDTNEIKSTLLLLEMLMLNKFKEPGPQAIAQAQKGLQYLTNLVDKLSKKTKEQYHA